MMNKGKGLYNPPPNQKTAVYNREILSERKIAEGRRIDIEQFPELAHAFGNMKWDVFLQLKGPIYPKLVREFYSSFTFKNGRIMFRINSARYNMTLEEFGNVLEVPTDGKKFYDRGHSLAYLPSFIDPDLAIRELCRKEASKEEMLSEGILSKHLKQRYDIWNKVIDHNIYCKLGNHSHVHATQFALLWCLENGEHVDMAYLMASRMSNLPKETTRALPYGMHLNKIFSHFKISHDESVPPSLTIMNLHTINKMGYETETCEEENFSDDIDEVFEEIRKSQANVEDISDSDEEEALEESNDPFFALDTDSKLEQIYKNQVKAKKYQSKIRKLVKDVIKAVSCQSQKAVEVDQGRRPLTRGSGSRRRRD